MRFVSRAMTFVAAFASAASLFAGSCTVRAQSPAQSPEAVQKTVRAFQTFGGEKFWTSSDKPDVLTFDFDKGLTDSDLRMLREEIIRSPLPIDLRLFKAIELTDEGLVHLRGLDRLVGLTLDGHKFSAAGLQQLQGLKNLRRLTVQNDNLSEEALATIGKLTGLQKLSIHVKDDEQAFGPTSYRHLAELVNLEELHVRYAVSDDELRFMTKMKKLTEVVIDGRKFVDPKVEKDGLFTDAGMAHVGELTGLKKLRLDGLRITPAGLAHLAKLTNLESLTVMSCDAFHGDATAALAPLTKLKELEAYSGAKLDAVAGSHIGKLPELVKLRWGSSEKIDVSGLAAAAKLEDLSFEGEDIVDADLEFIGRIKSLKRLNLQRNELTDAGMRHLADLTNLEELLISRNKLTDESLTVIGRFTKLKDLGIAECQIAGPGLKHLAKLPMLEGIWFGGNPITDRYLLDLGAAPALKHVFLPGTKTTEAGARALKKVLPTAWITDFSGTEVKLDEPARVGIVRKTVDVSKLTPHYTATAEEFGREYAADSAAADKKYRGQVIEITGEVRDVGRHSDSPVIFLKTGRDWLGMSCVTVDKEPWARVAPGQKIKVRGIAYRFLAIPTLTDAVVVDPGTSTTVQASAQALAGEYAADPEAFEARYKDKHAIVTGVVTARDFNSAGASSLVLKTEGKVKVVCRFSYSEGDLVKKLEVGNEARIFGGFGSIFVNRDEVALFLCLPVTEAK